MSFAPFQSWPTQNMEWIMSVFRKIDIPTDRICMSDYPILPWTLKSFHQEVVHPEVILPEVILPEVIHPEVIHPDVIHPEVILPEVIHPEVFRPKVFYPKVIHPVWETQKVNLIMLVSLFCFSSLNVLWGFFLGGGLRCVDGVSPFGRVLEETVWCIPREVSVVFNLPFCKKKITLGLKCPSLFLSI